MDSNENPKKTSHPPPLPSGVLKGPSGVLKGPSGVLKGNHRTEAAKFNRRAMTTLARRLRDDPEVNLLNAFPIEYDQVLKRLSTIYPKISSSRPPLPPRDTRTHLKTTDIIAIMSLLAEEVQRLLDQIIAQNSSYQQDQQNDSSQMGEDEDGSVEGSRDTLIESEDDSMEESDSEIYAKYEMEEQDDAFSTALITLLDRSEMLFQYQHGCSTMVLRVTDNIVAKLIRDIDNTTEYSSLQYLEDHIPSIPVPRPHGLVRIGRFLLMFSSFIAGEDLDKIWPKLNNLQKQDISSQLDAIFSELRSLPRPADLPLGGVKGEGCKDVRRWIRHSTKPIVTPKDFEEFIFSSPTTAKPPYVSFLKNFIPSDSDSPEPKCVFTHSDLRPANIRVVEEGGKWVVSGVIDWEFSGFYPDYWESLKITNTMGQWETSDWYQYLPESLSPVHNARRWLLDRIWDGLVK